MLITLIKLVVIRDGGQRRFNRRSSIRIVIAHAMTLGSFTSSDQTAGANYVAGQCC